MIEDKIIAAWNRMNPDSSTKERILREITDVMMGKSAMAEKNTMAEKNAMGIRKKGNGIKLFRRFAVGAAVAAVLLAGSLGSVYAASPAFREYVRSLLFPLYTPEEIVSIENGHMTGSFDKTDVLLTFLDRFNKKEFGNSITAAMENGYRYSLFVQNENQLLAFVDSSTEGYCIAVSMERIAYEDTAGIWQITGYQILEKSAAENRKKQLEPYAE
ncbi:MAG: hypothetical protein NC541_00190 [bacterium]|nr:hypothetical protein [bacterium]